MEATDPLVREKAFLVKDETVGDPIVHFEHARNGTDEEVNACAHNGDEHTGILEMLHALTCTRHQGHTGVGSKQLILMDGISHGFPHLDVGPHELNVADLTTNESCEVHGVVRPKRVVERSPRTHGINQDAVAVEDHNLRLLTVHVFTTSRIQRNLTKERGPRRTPLSEAFVRRRSRFPFVRPQAFWS